MISRSRYQLPFKYSNICLISYWNLGVLLWTDFAVMVFLFVKRADYLGPIETFFSDFVAFATG